MPPRWPHATRPTSVSRTKRIGALPVASPPEYGGGQILNANPRRPACRAGRWLPGPGTPRSRSPSRRSFMLARSRRTKVAMILAATLVMASAVVVTSFSHEDDEDVPGAKPGAVTGPDPSKPIAMPDDLVGLE